MIGERTRGSEENGRVNGKSQREKPKETWNVNMVGRGIGKEVSLQRRRNTGKKQILPISPYIKERSWSKGGESEREERDTTEDFSCHIGWTTVHILCASSASTLLFRYLKTSNLYFRLCPLFLDEFSFFGLFLIRRGRKSERRETLKNAMDGQRCCGRRAGRKIPGWSNKWRHVIDIDHMPLT